VLVLAGTRKLVNRSDITKMLSIDSACSSRYAETYVIAASLPSPVPLPTACAPVVLAICAPSQACS